MSELEDGKKINRRIEVCAAVGQSMKAIRIAKKLSQAELAFLADVDRTFVSHIERGMTNPTILSLAILCDALEVTLAQLFEPVNENFSVVGTGEKSAGKRKSPSVPVPRRLR